jgi:hypothetical protein
MHLLRSNYLHPLSTQLYLHPPLFYSSFTTDKRHMNLTGLSQVRFY